MGVDRGPGEPSSEPSLEDAVELATRAHAGQLDKVGEQYIGHPLRVMRAVADSVAETGVDRVQAQLVAVLHDVVEDTDLALEDLASLGYPPEVVAAVDALSHRPAESVEDYLARVAANDLAIVVKRADMADNSDPARLARLPEDLANHYVLRYAGRSRLLDDLVDERERNARAASDMCPRHVSTTCVHDM